MIYLIIASILLLIVLFPQTKKPHTYNAEWGDSTELSMFNHGFAVTGSKALSKKASHENCALFGPTGSGKSTVCIISSAISLARGNSSIIFNDVSGEIYDKTSGYLASQGYKILRLDFSNPEYETFNPLENCTSIADIQKLALLLVHNSMGVSKGDGVFWEQSSIMLISLFSRYLLFHSEPKYHTLKNVLRLVEKFAVDGPTVDKLISKTGDDELLEAYKATLVIGERTLQSVIASARTSLSLLTDPQVCRTTASNSIDFSLLRKEPVALYICNPLKDLLYYKPLSALFIQSLFNYALSRIPTKNERSIFFLIDEAATMKFPNLAVTVSNLRKFSAGLMLVVQDELSISAIYGNAEANQIKTNCGCQIFLRGQPLHTTRELAQVLGKHTYTDEKGIERTRELMTADEIRMSDEAIILIGNKRPLKCKTVPYYQNIWIHRHTKLPPYQLPVKDITEPHLIPFT